MNSGAPRKRLKYSESTFCPLKYCLLVLWMIERSSDGMGKLPKKSHVRLDEEDMEVMGHLCEEGKRSKDIINTVDLMHPLRKVPEAIKLVRKDIEENKPTKVFHPAGRNPLRKLSYIELMSTHMKTF